MLYKVFFVEDEIVTREGIRDNVDWSANGFEFCGEASDGEMALPLIKTARPDLLITDIKMPFMDGLQLCKIIRERMPGLKIIILSGHDEFEYAQKAIELGVTEYLLKPVTVQNIHQSLQRIASQLDQERKAQKSLDDLQKQVQENQASLRERLLLKLVVGAVSSSEAIEQGHLLGLDLIARCYLVVILKTRIDDRSEHFDYEEYRQVHNLITTRFEGNPDIFMLNRDWQELVVLMKGSTAEYLEEERDLLLAAVNKEIEATRYRLVVASGTPKKRLADIYTSFVEALVNLQNASGTIKPEPGLALNKEELLNINKGAVENYLRCGTKDGFERFFDGFVRSLGASTLNSYLVKNYIVADMIIATAKLVRDWGGDVVRDFPELDEIEITLTGIDSIESLRELSRKILLGALEFRDTRVHHQHARLIEQAKNHIDQHFMEPGLSLNELATLVNLSPSHFSTVFAQETSQTFKDYLTSVRIQKARELLRTTALRSSDISYQVGYNDPHYFSFVFKKNIGISPSEFRAQISSL
ncbi:MAG TPA: response regulator [Anaerolineales bacterium]